MVPANIRKPLLSAAILSTVLLFASSDVFAQASGQDTGRDRGRKSQRDQKQDAQKALFPDATRKEPETKASSKLGPKLQKMMDLYSENKEPETKAAADEILGNSSANAYERSLADQIAAQVAYGKDDSAGAKKYLQDAIQTNGLDNNGHYQSMFMLSQLQMQDEQYADALKTINTFLGETKSQKPDYLITKGNVLYRLQQYPEAITTLQQAVAAAGDTAKPEWQQLLMASYVEGGKPDEASKLAESLLAKNPADAKLQNNVAALYLQSGQNDKAIAILEKMRAGGQLTEENQYRNLYVTYLNTQGREKEAIAVIDDGIQKGILKSDYQSNVALAQAYFFSEQPAQSIEAYKKAAPLAPDGETYLNLAKVQWQEGKIGDAKKSAQQALDKGVKKPDDAKKILALKGA